MTRASVKNMREAIEAAKHEAELNPLGTTSGETSLTLEDRRDREIAEFLELLPVFRDASRLLKELNRKRKKIPNWTPTYEEYSAGTAAIREAKRRQIRSGSIEGLIEYEEGMDLPSSLDDESFDLID